MTHPLDTLMGAVSSAVREVASLFTPSLPKHANCRSAIVKVHPIFFDGKPRYMDIIQPEPYERYQIRKWLSQVPHGGIVDNMAVLIVYNEKYPELSYLTFEVIQ